MSENLQNVAVLPNDVSTSSQSGGLFAITCIMTFKKPNEGQSKKIYIRKYSVLPAFLKLCVSTVKAENIKIYDECGFNLDDCDPYYRHSDNGTRAVEIMKGGKQQIML